MTVFCQSALFWRKFATNLIRMKTSATEL